MHGRAQQEAVFHPSFSRHSSMESHTPLNSKPRTLQRFNGKVNGVYVCVCARALYHCHANGIVDRDMRVRTYIINFLYNMLSRSKFFFSTKHLCFSGIWCVKYARLEQPFLDNVQNPSKSYKPHMGQLFHCHESPSWKCEKHKKDTVREQTLPLEGRYIFCKHLGTMENKAKIG